MSRAWIDRQPDPTPEMWERWLHEAQDRYEAAEREVKRLRALLARVPVVEPCVFDTSPPRCGDCEPCRSLKRLDREVEVWDRAMAAPAGTKWVEVSPEVVAELREWSEPVQVRIEADRGDVATMLVRDYEGERKVGLR